MSHAIYQTPAWVLKTKNRGEANKLIWLYTRDLGLVYVMAQSIRAGSAKMRAHIHNLSFVDTDLVQGRDIWRLVGTHELEAGLDLVGTPWHAFFDKIAQLIVRLCTDQEVHLDLWNLIFNIRTNLPKDEESRLDVFEIYIVTQILSFLGYFDLPEDLVSENPSTMGERAREYTKKNKQKLIREINQALVSSQL